MPAVTEHRTGRPPKYPWDTWLDGEHAYTIQFGIHYTCSNLSFVQLLSRTARKRGMRAYWDYDRGLALHDVDELTIWALPDDEA